MANKSFRWWHAALIFVVVNLISGLPAGFSGDEAFYNSFQLPSVAPPDWLFPPMWLFLNITSLVALYRVANSVGSERRTRFLVAEAVGWVLFAIFATLYFWLQSPILAAIDTVLYGVLTLVSFYSCLGMDRSAALLIAPLGWRAWRTTGLPRKVPGKRRLPHDPRFALDSDLDRVVAGPVFPRSDVAAAADPGDLQDALIARLRLAPIARRAKPRRSLGHLLDVFGDRRELPVGDSVGASVRRIAFTTESTCRKR